MSDAHRIRLLGHTDQGGRPDGVQVMVASGHAYVGHMFSDGITVIDVADPRTPKPVQFIACPPNTRASHIQVHDGLMLAVNAANVWALQQYKKKEQDYFGKSLADSFSKRERSFAAGMRVFDLANPAAPREIGFMPVEGIGLHRIWWVGGRYAYASAHLEGFIDHILVVIDMRDPTKPELVGRWWFPGMHRAGGETPSWGEGAWALHHMITAGDLGYAAWRDGGMTVMDLADPVAPKLISHRNWSPPFAGGTHTPLPLPGRGLAVVADEATSSRCAKGLAFTWVLDVRAPDNPVTIATLPTPAGEDFCAKGGKFGPHNLHENRPGSFQSEDLIFATWHNAGLRVFDIGNAHEPKEVARFVPGPPERIVDIRPGAERVVQSTDVFAASDGTLFVTDTNGGLSILAYEG